MKATGIVRRIDDLGRVVIPKEIRRTMRIREGQAMEIYTGREGEIVLKKYSPVEELAECAAALAKSISSVTGLLVCISDLDQIICTSGPDQKKYAGKKISPDLEQAISERRTILQKPEEKSYFSIVQEPVDSCPMILAPILSAGDTIGSVLLLQKDPQKPLSEADLRIAKMTAGYLGAEMEA